MTSLFSDESSSSEESEEENEEEEDGFNGYEDIPESERKEATEKRENGETLSGGNVIATEEKLKEEIAEVSEEIREEPL